MSLFRLISDKKTSNPLKYLQENKINKNTSILQNLLNNISITQLPTTLQYGSLSAPLIIDKGDNLPLSTTLVFPQPDLSNRITAQGSPLFGLTKASFNLIDGGSGHSIGDLYKVTSPSCNIPAFIIVTSVDNNGKILNYDIWNNGYNFDNTNPDILFVENLSFFGSDSTNIIPATFSFIPDKFCIVGINMINEGSGYQWQNATFGPKYHIISCSVLDSTFLATAIVGPSISFNLDTNNKLVTIIKPSVVEKTSQSPPLSAQSESFSSFNNLSSSSSSGLLSSSSSSSLSSSSSSECVNINSTRNTNSNSILLTMSTLSLGALVPFSAVDFFRVLALDSKTINRNSPPVLAVKQTLSLINEEYKIVLQLRKEYQAESIKLGADKAAKSALVAKYNKLFEKRLQKFLESISSNREYRELFRSVIANEDFRKVVYNMYKINPVMSKRISEQYFQQLWNKTLRFVRLRQLVRYPEDNYVFLYYNTKTNRRYAKEYYESISKLLFPKLLNDDAIPTISSLKDCKKRFGPPGSSGKKGIIGTIIALILLSNSTSEAADIALDTYSVLTVSPIDALVEVATGTSLGSEDELKPPFDNILCLQILSSYFLDHIDDETLHKFLRTKRFDNFDFNKAFGISSTQQNDIYNALFNIKTAFVASGKAKEIIDKNLIQQFLLSFSASYLDPTTGTYIEADECWDATDINILALDVLIQNLQDMADDERDDFLARFNEAFYSLTPEQKQEIYEWMYGECNKEDFCSNQDNSNDGSLNIPILFEIPESTFEDLYNKYNGKLPLSRPTQPDCIK